MEKSIAGQADFSLAEVRGIVKDLLTPNPWIYWVDFLASLVGGSACFLALRVLLVRGSGDPAVKCLAGAALYGASCVLIYRAVLFIHELVHMRAGTFRTFRFFWNLLCGIPFLIPTFAYYTHVDHHMRSHFGTHHDGEYIPLGSQRPFQIVLYLLQPFIIPVLAMGRFLFLTPLCWALPGLRRWAHQRASSLVMDPSYIRPLPTPKALRIFRWQETACFLVLLGGAINLALGRLPVGYVVQSYFTAVGVLMLNNVRTLGAHRYVSGGKEMTFVEQLLDSLNYPHFSLLTPLWAPVGLRYHALHHLCPSLPYHNMGEAHRRLMQRLPADSPYRQTISPSLWLAIRDLWRRSSEVARQSDAAVAGPAAGAGGGPRRKAMSIGASE
jgi:fatty acid desaturase